VIPVSVKTVLDRHGLSAIVFDEDITPTAPLAAQALGVQVGQIAKSLLFKGKDGRFFMVVCPGDRRVSNSKLKRTVGIKTRMATAEETRERTGFDPGGVCPFGVEGIEIILDTGLAAWDTIYPAAGTAGSGVPMTLSDLADITSARVDDVSDAAQ
jgi:prolyl-tRNA editing enzyme YbaK/EbsC (Cys-tRNA(Pro) deacylase)